MNTLTVAEITDQLVHAGAAFRPRGPSGGSSDNSSSDPLLRQAIKLFLVLSMPFVQLSHPQDLSVTCCSSHSQLMCSSATAQDLSVTTLDVTARATKPDEHSPGQPA